MIDLIWDCYGCDDSTMRSYYDRMGLVIDRIIAPHGGGRLSHSEYLWRSGRNLTIVRSSSQQSIFEQKVLIHEIHDAHGNIKRP